MKSKNAAAMFPPISNEILSCAGTIPLSCWLWVCIHLDSRSSKENPIVREYILPDFSSNKCGRIRQLDEVLDPSVQILHMNNERFAVPELLFRPDDIGEGLIQ